MERISDSKGVDNEEGDDYLFVEIDESLTDNVPACDLVAAPLSRGAATHSRYRQFQGLADVSLEQLSYVVFGPGDEKFGGVDKMEKLHSPFQRMSEEHVMKLRSIMRFATEYHNALLVRTAQFEGKETLSTSPLLQFVETADSCFGAICKMIMCSKKGSFQEFNQYFEAFVQAALELKSVEEAVKRELWSNDEECPHPNKRTTTLEQAVTAVVGQMDDFHELVSDVQGSTRQI